MSTTTAYPAPTADELDAAPTGSLLVVDPKLGNPVIKAIKVHEGAWMKTQSATGERVYGKRTLAFVQEVAAVWPVRLVLVDIEAQR